MDTTKRARLCDRALMLKQARAFFDERNVLEVDCPAISPYASIDTHIDLIPCTLMGKIPCWLHSSPEYGMKKLIAQGMGDIFQLSHVFRDFEEGVRHKTEFMMAEWYRMGFSYQEMIEETCAFITLFLGNKPITSISYQESFFLYTGIDPMNTQEKELLTFLEKKGVMCPYDSRVDTIDDLLAFTLSAFVEPHLGENNTICALTYFPPSQAALAKVSMYNKMPVAERFEVFYNGMELANGYHELQDADEQYQRLCQANEERKKRGKEVLPIDIPFIEALRQGMPACSGVAVGFDRLMMLRHKARHIEEITSF